MATGFQVFCRERLPLGSETKRLILDASEGEMEIALLCTIQVPATWPGVLCYPC